MPPSISTLHPPPDSRPSALALKLSPEVLHQVRTLCRSHTRPKLVVKDGQFLVKISDTLVFPCAASPETLRLDIYSPSSPRSKNLDYHFTGTVTSRLNVLSDPKLIKEHLKLPVSGDTSTLPPPASNPTSLPEEAQKKRPSSADLKAYAITSTDSDAERVYKFVSFLALGPMPRQVVEDKLQLARFLRNSEIDLLFASHTQPFLRRDTFTDGDVYPLLSAGKQADITSQDQYVILKDKAYKELRPWCWPVYTDYEQQLILDNCHKALSRLGFLETHPLRLQIVERLTLHRNVKKSANLGGGFIVSSAKKAHSNASHAGPSLLGPGSPSQLNFGSRNSNSPTESPLLNGEARKKASEKGKKDIGLPLRPEESSVAQGLAAGLVLSLSSEDEKVPRKISAQKRGKRHSDSSNSNSYMLPSSVNEEAHLDQSDHDIKHGTRGNDSNILNISSANTSSTSNIAKMSAAASLPNRPSSSFTNHEKKQQYYSQLADKFRLKYKEYECLHRQLGKDTRKNTHIEKKKALMKLFELHNTLSEWKRRLWDYHNENNMAEGVMNLSKHRKVNSLSKISSLAPLTSKISSTDRFAGASAGGSGCQSPRELTFSERPVSHRVKLALDY